MPSNLAAGLTNIGSATANSSGVYTFEDTNAPLHWQRFYRAVGE
jgi:hypothetical protein